VLLFGMDVKTMKPYHSAVRVLRGKDLSKYLYILPATVIVAVVTFFPLFNTFVLSLQSYILSKPQLRGFVGTSNYVEMWNEPLVRGATVNTLVYTASTVLLSLVFGLLLALLVNSLNRGKQIFRTLFVVEMLLAPVVVGVIWRFLFNHELGIINYLISAAGFEKVSWLSKPRLAMLSIVVVDVWQWTPYVFLVLEAGLESLPLDPFEAARIDGANGWQIFRFITFPYLSPFVIVAATFRFMWAFRGFDHIYTLTQGGPGNATETFALAVWRMGFSRLNVGMASAISVVMFLIMAGISVVLLKMLTGKLQA
jgi:multiple sugar transport system permease protein